jgi:hypothetical protein
MQTARFLVLLGLAFVTGVLVARAQSSDIMMRGVVKDANTLPEQIQYWEIREGDGVSIIIAGSRDLPVVAWLQNAKGRRVVLTIARDEAAASARAPAAAASADKNMPKRW